MSPATLLILRHRARALRRWVGDHAFEIFCLAPIIVVGVLWALDRQLTHLRDPLVGLFAGADPLAETASLSLALLLVALGLPATFRELYGRHRASSCLDPLPVSAAARFHATLAVELARAVPVLGVLLFAVGALAGDLLPAPAALAERCARLVTALATLAIGRFAVALAVAHWRPLARGGWLVAGAVAGVALAAPGPIRSALLLPWLAPAAQLETVFRNALAGPADAETLAAGPWALALTFVVLYGVARVGYLAWHRRDLEAAAHLGGKRRLSVGRLGLVRGDQVLAVQVGRDLALVLRRFSHAVPLAVGLALLADATVITALADTRWPDLWRQRLAVAGLTLSVLALVALLPFLLKHQLPRFWIEKSTGVDFEQVWRAKLWTAALLAAAPVLAGTVILLAAPLPAAAKGVGVLQLAAAAWVVTSILALGVFEIAAQPLLGLLFGSLLGLALAALFVFYPQAWWLWAVAYLWVAGQVAGRASRRVRLLEIET